ncbi:MULTISPECIES: hypothetical protein [Ramlibacter]|uniref:Toxin-antitoxin system HicB family antitoxin n=1 Tax=Ramlibacter pinisoli TaxID=2682844 RepID=A0A6N8IUS1_9BURK|nr:MULTISPECIES: hypothetical protein [Ramlibacter]MBA2960743.1 hypothetical protein [Ramlibacter sp. CGMCC 1.13660]MVQ30691.1 hypothetical protein [Ramlibacter pinisoli]
MSYPLRLTPELQQRARERAAEVGISFNALVAVALDAYLRCGQVAAPTPRPAARRPRAATLPAAGAARTADRPDWRFFNPDPDFWPMVDPEFAHRWECVDPEDTAVSAALEIEYWSTRKRPA